MKVHTIFDRPKKKASPSGTPIYEYEYRDPKDGKLKTAKKNIQEKIQSCLQMTDYKAKIAAGEEILINGNIGEGIRDFTNIPGDKANLIDFIGEISRMDQEQVNEIIKKLNPEREETKQEIKQTTVENGEVKPDGDKVDTGNNEGGAK